MRVVVLAIATVMTGARVAWGAGPAEVVPGPNPSALVLEDLAIRSRFHLPEDDRRWLAERAGTLVVGVERDYPPFSFVDESGQHEGLAVDYLTRAESVLGIHFRRSTPASLDELLAGAQAGRIHVLTSVKPNPERLKYLHFTRPFVDVPVVLLTADAPGSRLEEYSGKRIATARGYAVADHLAREYPGIGLALFSNDYEAILGVVGGKADAAVVDLATATYLRRQHGLSALKVAGTIDFSYNLCLAATDERLARILDQVLESMSLDERRRLHEPWFMPSQDTRLFPETLAPEERAWLKRHPVLRVLADAQRGPIEYAGPGQERLGLSAEYLDRVGTMLGVRYKYMAPSAVGGKYLDLAEGRADIVSCASRTAGLKPGVRLTPAYASAPIVLFARGGQTIHATLAELEGQTLAVRREGEAAALIGKDFPGICLLPVASAGEGLKRLRQGECAAFAGTLAVGNYYLAQGGWTDIRVVGDTPYVDEICMAVADPLLASILGKALDALPAADRDAMARKWFSVQVERVRDYSLVWKILLGAGVGFAIFIWWNRRLSREVKLRRKAEADLTASNEKLEAANKELEAFSYSVSHDLRAPLRHVGSYVELLVRHAESGTDEKIVRYARIIGGAANKMGHLIDDLLAFSRLGRMQMRLKSVSLAEVVSVSRQELEPETKGRAIEWEIGELPTVKADESLLHRVFVNLLGNAIKYTRKRDVARIAVSAVRDGQEVIVTIRDNGAGFNMAYQDKLFGVFQRLHADAEFEGTGIGLANVRRIIVRHGGRVWAEGEIGKGAAFHFTLPA